jgi:DNA-binding MarR family transcriptional regulator
MSTKPVAKSTSKEERALHQKWGADVIAEGYTVLPNVILQNQKALDLKHLDVLVLMCLLSHWWDKDDLPRPAKTSIARTLDVDPRTVQRSIAKLEKQGYIERKERRATVGDNLPNFYDLSGLVAAAKTQAERVKKLKTARAKEDSAMQSTPKTFGLIEGGKTK